MMIHGTHDNALVALSIAIAALASYTALDLAGRIRSAEGWWRHAWLSTSAVTMGGGIWSMHFVAMLAFSMPGMQVHYDVVLTALSLLVAIVLTGAAFLFVSRAESGLLTLGISGLIMGLGIAAMHYTGMAAMRVPVALDYDPFWLAISILVAIGAATIALRLSSEDTGPQPKLVAAVVMGLAISGMHYSAMQAATFTAGPSLHQQHVNAALNQTTVAVSVAAITFLILSLALTASMFDRRFAALADREAAAHRQSEERFRSLYRRTPLPLHALDAEGLIGDVSDAWLRLLGFARDDVIGRPLVDFMAKESADRFKTVDQARLAETGCLENAEYQMTTRTGDEIDVLLSTRIERDEHPPHLRAVGGLVDVTARRQAEEALRQAQKMEAVGQLTGGVAHDFNNLLSVVLGNLELLNKRVSADAGSARMIRHATEAAKRGAALTQRMLAFARQQSLKPTAVDVPLLVRGMKDLMQRSLGPHIRIETRFPLALPPLRADTNQLELALLNLAVNSRDAMPEGGVITIGAREERVATAPDSGLAPGLYVCLSVTDTGQGMDDATLARAHEPFFTTKAVGKGTGLGLSMIHGFAAQSSGTLVLRSREGEGTTAELWLPAEPERVERSQEPCLVSGAPVHELAPAVILAVDDDFLVLMNTVDMLEDLGHRVLQAGTGQDALNLVRTIPEISLIITDHAMPGMTGMQLASAILAEKPDLPILLATGYAELPDGSGAHLPLLGKPFDQAALKAAVADCLSAKKGPTPLGTRQTGFALERS